ncbi:hypothetical protein ACKVMH_10090 [Lysobacter zhanggongensis]|uniref:Transmembrane protein n=1 Tax=Lysobacter zhanggongensis TaxID=1774951 RepID=A0ABU7YSG3_9GAMM
MAALSKPKVLALLYIVMVTLSCVFAFLAIPEFNYWALGTVPALAFALRLLRQRQNRMLLVASYALLGIGGLAVGHFYLGSTGAEGRIVMFLVAVPVIGLTLARIGVVELGKA